MYLQILVYTGGQDSLYQRVRDTLSTVLPSNLYTVFHISTEAIRKQPWIEPSSVSPSLYEWLVTFVFVLPAGHCSFSVLQACLLLADTSGLDDCAWAKMHTYFNHVCRFLKFFVFLTYTSSGYFGSSDSVPFAVGQDHFCVREQAALQSHQC